MLSSFLFLVYVCYKTHGVNFNHSDFAVKSRVHKIIIGREFSKMFEGVKVLTALLSNFQTKIIYCSISFIYY